MKSKCIEAVSKALGRPISQTEAQGIEERIRHAMRQLGSRDPQRWQAMSLPDRQREAARFAADDLTHAAELKRLRVAQQIKAHDANLAIFNDLTAGGERPYVAVSEILDRADIARKGVERQYFSRMIQTLEATEPRFFGLVEDARGVRDLVLEIFGKDSGNPVAKAGAKAWLETVEAMRQRFNRGGGDIGKLRYGYLPQPHDPARIRAVPMDEWATRVLRWIDRSRYVDEAGRQLDDVAMSDVLGMMYRTLVTEGVNKIEPGEFRGRAMEAKHFSQHREIHFKGPEAYLEYMAEYGRGTVFLSMQHHVGRLARDIALVENLGPNASGTVQFLRDHARKLGDSDRVGPFLVSTDDMWTSLSGRSSTTFDGGPFYQRLADIAQGVRNIEVVGKLQSATLSSVTDIPTYFITVGFNRLPFWQAAVNLVRAAGPESRKWANRAGLISESVISDLNRWGENNIGMGWTGRLANATMKASLLNGWTDTLKRAFSLTMMNGLGRLSRAEWGVLADADRAHLSAKGVTETDFRVWRMATPEDWRGEAMLTPEAIARIPDSALTGLAEGRTPAMLRDSATSRLLGAITDEAEFAVTTPDLQTRAAIQRGTQRGTIEGELLRSVMLFKSFPFAMVTRHWERAFEGGAGTRLAYGAALVTGLTMFGAIALQLKDLKDGKDPRDMTTLKFWAAAFAQGGGAGIFGDFLYTGAGGQGRAGLPNWMSLAGPVVGTALETVDLTVGNAFEAARGKDTHIGAEALRLARSHTPLVNLWYAKAAFDHAGLHSLQEMLSPGYLERMQERERSEWGQERWWTPGSGMPERAPNVDAAFGR
jgi:hypothetical protein